jgi:ferredoxin-NADP reductase
VAVWSFDRALRIGRIITLNLSTFKAIAAYNQEANIIRVTVPTRNLSHPQPGTYYYVYLFPGVKLWESRPFTLSSWSSKQPNNSLSVRNELTFMVRPYDGFTSRLREHVIRQSEESNGPFSPLQIRMAIEGPYGTPFGASKNSSILFIIGGSGITFALSHLQALRESLQENQSEKKRSRVHSIRLVWAVRDAALLEHVYQHDLLEWRESSMLTRQVDFRMDVHATRSVCLGLSCKALSMPRMKD